MRVHYPDIKNSLLREAMKAFYSLREIDQLRKKPSTSELIDWIKVLIAGGIPFGAISEQVPFIGTLLKKETDFDHFARNYMKGTGGNPVN